MPTTGIDGPGKGPTAKIFISYSREDSTFADRLAAALSARGFEALIDRTEVYAFEDWWQRIQTLVGRADTVVFVLSPDAVASDICQKEVAFAMSLNKRLAPIIWRRVDDKAVPEALRRLNFIFFQHDERFDACIEQLTDALRTNIEWVRQHTAFGEQARRWESAERTSQRGLLLRSPVLEEAERWIASRPHDAPMPTQGTRAFVMESRRAATKRRNILSGGLGVGLVIALALAGFAYWQREIAVEQRRSAEEQRSFAEEQRKFAEEQRKFAEEQRGIAVEQRSLAEQQRTAAQASETRANRTLARADHQKAAQLVEEAPPKPARALAYLARAIRSDPANSAVGRRAIGLVAEHPHIRPATMSVWPAMGETRAFKVVDGRKGVRSPDGRWALRFTNNGVQVRKSGARNWLAVEEQVKFTLDYTLGVFAKSSHYAVVVGGYWTEFGGHNEIKVIDEDGTVLARRTFGGDKIQSLALSPDGRLLFVDLVSPRTGGGIEGGRWQRILFDVGPNGHQLDLVELRVFEGQLGRILFSPDSRFVQIDGDLFQVGSVAADERLPAIDLREVRFSTDSMQMHVLTHNGNWIVYDTATNRKADVGASVNRPLAPLRRDDINVEHSSDAILVKIAGMTTFRARRTHIMLGGISEDGSQLIWFRDDGAAQVVAASMGVLEDQWRSVERIYGNPWHEWTHDFLTIMDGRAVRWLRIYRADIPRSDAWKKIFEPMTSAWSETSTRVALHPTGKIAAIGVGGYHRVDIKLVDLERIPVMFEHSRHGERSSCILAG
jgi:hypothetical protein